MSHLRRVLWSFPVVIGALSNAGGLPAFQAQPAGPQHLSVPTVRVEAVSPTVVRLTATTAAGERIYHVAVRKRLEGGTEQLPSMPLQGQSYTGTEWHGMDSVLAGSTYRYQVMAAAGSVAELSSDWSPDVIVRTPAAPTRPPAAPRKLSAKALGSYQVELTWEDRSNNEYGFEILRTDQGPPIRLALVDPNITRFVLHGRAPGSTAEFSVRAFNPVDVSLETAAVVVHLPALSAGADSAPGVSPTIGPCRTRDEAIHDVELAGDTDSHVLDRRLIQNLGGDLNLDVMPEPGLCGQNCIWYLYGNYGGCYRKLAELFAARIELVGKTPAGSPLILQLGHMGGMRTGFSLSKLEKGSLVELDSFIECDNPSEESTELSPLFEKCQFDDEIVPHHP